MTAKLKRLILVRQTGINLSPTRTDFVFRNLTSEDTSLLGPLMFEAYKGTIDDEGQTLEESLVEAGDTLKGKYGKIIWPASFIAMDKEIAAAATVVTDYVKTGPLLAFVLTSPSYQKRGLGTKLIELTLNGLAKAGIKQLRLVVTELNENALRLYIKLGFAIESIKE
ncbi:MAG: GNAT family N-acetyltransferase [Candidatus Obscuribacterales bacterium]|nr:GNAT family N-acetyltransferase [Candidatus Obscuribacterales bacterium]